MRNMARLRWRERRVGSVLAPDAGAEGRGTYGIGALSAIRSCRVGDGGDTPAPRVRRAQRSRWRRLG